MFIKIALSALLSISSISFASETQSNAAFGSDGSSPKSSTSMANVVSATKSGTSVGSWLQLESKTDGTTKWRTNVRFDNAPSQTLEYVVNCQDRSVALSSFGVQTDTGTKVFSYDNRLNFYKPTMAIDSNLVASTCNNRVAMNDTVRAE